MPSDRDPFAHLEIDPNIARSWTLPSDLYTDPSVLVHEQQRVFGRTWQVAGRSEQVARPGDYFTCQVAGEPLLVVRDAEGELRAFHNVCRHRAGPPAESCGSRKVFRCSYHGWTYGLDGHLITAPEFEGAQDFRAEEFGLRPLQAEEWAAWVFVNLDDSADLLLSALGKLPQQAQRFPLDRLRFFERREYVMRCNWKTYVDNYLEGYHLPSVHPGLNRELDYGQYVIETFTRHSQQSSPIRGPENERDAPRRYPEAAGLSAEYFWIFPNWMLNCYPDNVSLNIIVPLGQEQTLAVFEWYVVPELMASEVAQAGVRFSHEIQLEDGDICERVQRNLHSHSYQRGRFSVKQEKGVHHFHRLYAEWMRDRG